MNLRKSISNWGFSTQMRAKDWVTEAQLGLRGSSSSISRGQLLGEGFDNNRIKIFWPSAYSWPVIHKWLAPLLNEFKAAFEVQKRPIPFYPKVTVFEIEVDGETYPIAIDRYDKTYIDEECAANVLIYFKMQYANEGYSHKNVVPGGFIPAYSNIYLEIEQLRELRAQRKFSSEVYGRFGARVAKTIRGEATEQLKGEKRFQYNGGIGRVSYKKSLFEIATAKVCIDLPGNGPLCFRLVDYLAVGSCIIAYPHHAALPVPLADRKEIVYCKEDLSDLGDLCEYYLNNKQERETIAQNSRTYFDQNLARPQLAAYYIKTILSRLGKL